MECEIRHKLAIKDAIFLGQHNYYDTWLVLPDVVGYTYDTHGCVRSVMWHVDTAKAVNLSDISREANARGKTWIAQYGPRWPKPFDDARFLGRYDQRDIWEYGGKIMARAAVIPAEFLEAAETIAGAESGTSPFLDMAMTGAMPEA